MCRYGALTFFKPRVLDPVTLQVLQQGLEGVDVAGVVGVYQIEQGASLSVFKQVVRLCLRQYLDKHLWLVGEDGHVEGRVALAGALKVHVGTVLNQVERDFVVAESGGHVKRRHAVHERLHEALLLDRVVIIIRGLRLFFLLD